MTVGDWLAQDFFSESDDEMDVSNESGISVCQPPVYALLESMLDGYDDLDGPHHSGGHAVRHGQDDGGHHAGDGFEHCDGCSL